MYKRQVLNGNTVFYASYDSIKDTLDYDFGQEKAFSYEGLAPAQAITHIAKFTAGIWQIHPFCEGNTRTTAVFILKYLRTFGFSVSNDVFAENSWYFRNALVRANYNDFKSNISATVKYLELFFENLLLGYHNELKNRYLHVDYKPDKSTEEFQSVNSNISKWQNDTLNDTLNCSFEEMAILAIIKKDPYATQKQMAQETGKSESTVKRRTAELQSKGIIRRENGKRNGKWEIVTPLQK